MQGHGMPPDPKPLQRDVRVTALNVYPVKSCAGTPLEVAEIGRRGIRHDREFMVVALDDRFLTQRECPRLALVQPSLRDERLTLSAPGMPPLSVHPTDDGPRRSVGIWRDTVAAVDQGDQAAEWLSTYLGAPTRLVRMPADSVRLVDPHFARTPTDQVGFADGYPLLLISEESLEDLNSRLAQPLPMNRFRPNVVVRGSGAPYAEDGWAELRIRDVRFDVVKACARCAITTTDQATAERGHEPLATLARYRQVPRGVLFGQNLIHAAEGVIAVGDALMVLRRNGLPPA
jgi:uncharacterized protein YcbX